MKNLYHFIKFLHTFTLLHIPKVLCHNGFKHTENRCLAIFVCGLCQASNSRYSVIVGINRKLSLVTLNTTQYLHQRKFIQSPCGVVITKVHGTAHIEHRLVCRTIAQFEWSSFKQFVNVCQVIDNSFCLIPQLFFYFPCFNRPVHKQFSVLWREGRHNIFWNTCEEFFEVYHIHLDRHSTVKHLAREREDSLIHIDSSHDNQVGRQGQTFFLEPRFQLSFVVAWRRFSEDMFNHIIPQTLAYLIRLTLLWLLDDADNRVRFIHFLFLAIQLLPFRLCPALDGTKKLCEIFLNRCKIHFIQTKEIGCAQILPCFCHKLNEWCKNIVRWRYVGNISNHIHRAVPVRFYLYQLKIPRARVVKPFLFLVCV